MGYRKHAFTLGGIYHIYNRGVEKRNIFLDKNDRIRFRALLLHCIPQEKTPSYSLSRKEKQRDHAKKRLVNILCYCLMPNHFHLLLQENAKSGISKFMQRLMNSYARYFNTKYERTGPLLSGPFRSVAVSGDDQFLHLTRYIHLNPYAAKMIDDPFQYEWSSLEEYIGSSKYKFCQSRLLKEIMEARKYRDFMIDYADYARELADIKHLLHDNT